MPPRPETPGDLHFGLLALQTGLIGQAALVAAFRDWTRTPGRSMAEILVGRGDLDADQRAALDGLASQHLKKHGGDPEKGLASIAAGPSTRRELARLASPDLDASLDSLATAVPADDAPHFTASHSIGTATSDGQRFRVLRPHAQGGLGAVFVALDGELNREVALKQILDRHADEPNNRSRFLVEAEITGGLEHPGIVPVYGLGHDPTGRPYYAMRFIRGDSLKEAIAAFHEDGTLGADPGRRSLELRKLLRRFVDVCNAIEYAHSRGILHRDIKPGNIIVGKHGETLVVDWGLAKPMGQAEPGAASGEGDLRLSSSSGGGSSETLPGSAVGTPAYMSPEQAAGDLGRLGSRSDVYSLGATLYSLLTGRPPFGGRDLAAVLRAVQEGDFAHPRAVDPGLDPALEAICLKAMATDLEARYESPRGLADDLERWSADEPVSAYSEPLARRFRRWARRHRTAVSAASAATLAALIGLASVLAIQSRANRDLGRKNGELIVAGGKIQARFDLAQEAIGSFERGVKEDLILDNEQFRPLRNKLLRSAAEFYGKLGTLLEGQPDRRSRLALAAAYGEIGDLTARIGIVPDALAAYRKELSVRRQLAPDRDARDALNLVRCLTNIGSHVGNAGDEAGALASFEEARGLVEGGSWSREFDREAGEALATVHNNLGFLLGETGEPTRAIEAHRRALEAHDRVARAHPAVAGLQADRALTYSNIGIQLDRIGRPVEAMQALRRALEIRERIVQDGPEAPEIQFDLATTYNSIATLLAKGGESDRAMEAHRRALVIREKLAGAHPAVAKFQAALATTQNNIATLLDATGHPMEATEPCGLALAIQAKLVVANPDVAELRADLARSHSNLGALLGRVDRPIPAMESYNRALEIRTELAGSFPAIPKHREELADTLNNIGFQSFSTGDLAGATAAFRRSLEVRQELARSNPAIRSVQVNLMDSHSNLGLVAAHAQRADEAVASLRESVAQGLRFPRDPEFLFKLVNVQARLAGVASLPGSGLSAAEARAEADRVMAFLHRAVSAGYREPEELRTHVRFDALRDRADFQLLMLDQAFPDDPFGVDVR